MNGKKKVLSLAQRPWWKGTVVDTTAQLIRTRVAAQKRRNDRIENQRMWAEDIALCRGEWVLVTKR